MTSPRGIWVAATVILPNLPVTHSSPISTWPSNYAVRAGLWVLLVMAVTLPSQLPFPHHCFCFIVNIKQFMEFLYFIFFNYPRLLFLDVETNPGLRRPVNDVCQIFCSNVQGLAWNFSDLTISLLQYDIMLCFETGIRYASPIRVACSPIWLPCLVVLGQDVSGSRDGCIPTRWLQIISPTQIWVLLQNAGF